MRSKKFWLISILTILINGFFAVLNLGEFFKTRILKHTEDYNFGGEGPVPYYYSTDELYSTVNLFWGLLFLLTLVFTTLAILKRQYKSILIALGLTSFLVLTMLIHGQIGTN